MRIQIIEKGKQHYNETHLEWFKETINAYLNECGAAQLDWLHAETIDLSCDVFLEAISPAQVKIGFVYDDCQVYNSDHPLHWVTITALENLIFDTLTQTLLVITGMSCMQSVTGGVSTDWTDIKVALSLGTTAYCSIFDWNKSQLTIELLRAKMSQPESPVDVASCVMLLNQGLPIRQVFENIQDLLSAEISSADCLTITNVTNSEKIPQTNVLMFVCKNT